MAFTCEHMVEIEEAQKLERELAQSKEANAGLMRACDKLERELAEAKAELKKYTADSGDDSLYNVRRLRKELAEVTKQRDALAEALPLAMARAFNRGYQFGHEDTVESTFVIVNAKEALDYFADDVRQMLLDGSQPEAQKALAATKGGDV